MTEEQKTKFFEEQEARIAKLRSIDPLNSKKDFSILEKKQEKKKPYHWSRYKNFNMGMQDRKKLWD